MKIVRLVAAAVVAHVVTTMFRNQLASVVGALFFVGGIGAARMIPAPAWFSIADLGLAYFPMAFLATKIGHRLKPV